MKLILLTSIFIISIPVFADDIQREIEYEAIIGRAHVRTPVTRGSRMPSSA